MKLVLFMHLEAKPSHKFGTSLLFWNKQSIKASIIISAIHGNSVSVRLFAFCFDESCSVELVWYEGYCYKPLLILKGVTTYKSQHGLY